MREPRESAPGLHLFGRGGLLSGIGGGVGGGGGCGGGGGNFFCGSRGGPDGEGRSVGSRPGKSRECRLPLPDPVQVYAMHIISSIGTAKVWHS